MTDKQKAVLVSVLVLGTAIAAVAGLTACQLYQTVIRLETRRLQDIVHSHAALIEQFTSGYPGASLGIALRLIRDAHAKAEAFGSTGELVMASRDEGGRITFLTAKKDEDKNAAPLVLSPADQEIGQPMRRALAGESGSMIGLDYQGKKVLAAFAPLPKGGFGLVAKIDMAEIQKPFIRTMLLVDVAAVLVILAGIVILLRFNPFLHRLERERTKTQNYLDIAGTMIVVLDIGGKITQINLKGCEVLAAQHGQLLGLSWVDDCVHEEERKDAASLLDQLLRGRKAQIDGVELRLRTADGEERIVEWSGRAVRDSKGRISGVISAGTDITERKRMEAELLLAKQEFQATFEQAAVGIGHIAMDGRLLRVNQKLCSDLGYPCEELLGKTVQDVTCPDHLEHSLALAKELLNDRLKSMYAMQKQYVRRDGTKFWVNDTVSLVRDEQGMPQYYISVTEDIQARKEMENTLRQRGEDLARSNKELDDFAYIASHDLKEPLRGIMSYSNFLMEDFGDKLGEEGISRLKTMEDLTRRLSALTDDLLVFSRVGRLELAYRTTDLNILLEDVLATLKMSLEKEKITVRIPGQLPSVKCDAVRMREVFHNLISNAIKYSDKPEKWIEIGALKQWNNLQKTVFYVCDNGIGIPDRHADKVFTMFKRLHGRDKYGGGTGAGLAIVKKIIERHEGRIWLESTAGEGTSFFFTIGRNLQ
jgi:PAS domain S-box-containing protein